MKKMYKPIFTLNIAVKPKRTVSSSSVNNRISRKCLAKVIKLKNGEYRASVDYNKNKTNDEEVINDNLIIPFTDSSFNLNDKLYIFKKDRDSNGHLVCVIRTKDKANRFPNVNDQYESLKENLLIAGHIIRRNGKMYFEYEDLIAYHYLSENHIQEVKIDENKPLFK